MALLNLSAPEGSSFRQKPSRYIVTHPPPFGKASASTSQTGFSVSKCPASMMQHPLSSVQRLVVAHLAGDEAIRAQRQRPRHSLPPAPEQQPSACTGVSACRTRGRRRAASSAPARRAGRRSSPRARRPRAQSPRRARFPRPSRASACRSRRPAPRRVGVRRRVADAGLPHVEHQPSLRASRPSRAWAAPNMIG